jgi:hypothetical protein
MILSCGSIRPTKPIKAKCNNVYEEVCDFLPDWDGVVGSAPNLLGIYGAMYLKCAIKEAAAKDCLDKLKKAGVIE